MGVYIKGITKQELKEIFGKACILYNSADLVDIETPLIPDKIERGSVTMICDAVIIHCDDYFDMMLKSAAIDNGSWERFITNETKQGEWKIIGYDPLDVKFKCNTCGLKCNLATPYCPECGAKMKGADDETD